MKSWARKTNRHSVSCVTRRGRVPGTVIRALTHNSGTSAEATVLEQATVARNLGAQKLIAPTMFILGADMLEGPVPKSILVYLAVGWDHNLIYQGLEVRSMAPLTPTVINMMMGKDEELEGLTSRMRKVNHALEKKKKPAIFVAVFREGGAEIEWISKRTPPSG